MSRRVGRGQTGDKQGVVVRSEAEERGERLCVSGHKVGRRGRGKVAGRE